MLKSILMVWVLVQNVPATQEAYEAYLGYQIADRGVISAELAEAIKRPRLANRSYVTLVPKSGPQVGIRIIEGADQGYQPMRRLGWSAIELLVKDPERLRTSLVRVPHLRICRAPIFSPSRKTFSPCRFMVPARSFFISLI